jgi:hypothetical protein
MLLYLVAILLIKYNAHASITLAGENANKKATSEAAATAAMRKSLGRERHNVLCTATPLYVCVHVHVIQG